MPKVIVPLADGFEEIEAVCIIDVLRRAGIEVIVAGVGGESISGAHGITIKADRLLEGIKAEEIDMIVLPGGVGGTEILSNDALVQSLLKEMDAKNKMIGAICAAPIALKSAGVLKEHYTCYPSCEETIKQEGYDQSKKVVTDHNIMTSQGPGTAICFGLEIVRRLFGEQKYRELKSALLADYC